MIIDTTDSTNAGVAVSETMSNATVTRPDISLTRGLAFACNTNQLIFRDTVTERDVNRVRGLVASSNMFTPQEMDVAAELVVERLLRDRASGYHFIFSEMGDMLLGYACYGPIPCAQNRFDLYWIAVQREHQNKGIGTILLQRSELAMRDMGARRIYVDTSSLPMYFATRQFYERNGYRKVAELEGFYSENDCKVIYSKSL
jgi:ribosomal protein S18 acetylase RimI-like enzyme